MKRDNLKVLIYGAGRVGGTLYYTLKGCGIKAFRYSRNRRGLGYLSLRKIVDTIDSFDLIILSVPDSNIEAAVREFYRHIPVVSNRVILHTSGTMSYRILEPLMKKGFIIGSLHPYFSFFEIRRDVHLEDIRFGLSCNKGSFESIGDLLDRIGIDYEFIDDDKKVPYHISAVFVSNFTALLLRMAYELLGISGIKKNREEYIFSLLNSTLHNLRYYGIRDTITGPAIRRDKRVLDVHKKFLSEYNPMYLNIYQIISRIIQSIYK